MKCQIVTCQREAERSFGDVKICATHFRVFTIGEFGERAHPKWDRSRAQSALIEQDGLTSEVAAKRVEDFFGPEPE